MTMLATEVDNAMKEVEGIAKVGTAVSLAIHNAILAGGKPVRAVADALHGTWLGHPLHPVLTDITIGGWVLGGIFDAIGGITKDPTIRRTADRLIEAGTIAAIPTALTGATDFSTFPDWSATPATLHGAANLINIVLYAFSIRERRRGNRGRGIVLSTVGLGLSCITAWLGGVLVYKEEVGVDHRDRFEGPKKWTPIFDEDDLPQRKPTLGEFDDKPILLYRDGRDVFAIGATCSHAGGPLNEGKVDGSCITCPWHDSVFNLRTGAVVHGPATAPQPRFDARIRGKKVEVRLARP